MGLMFDEDAVVWLERNRFKEQDMEKAIELLNSVWKKAEKSKEGPIIVPKETPKDVAALVYLLSSITDEKGKILCFREHGLVSIPDEARKRFPEFVELHEIESVTDNFEKAKFGRKHMDARRRGSVVRD